MRCFRLLALLMVLSSTVYAQVNVPTQHNDNQRTGANLAERTLNVGTVHSERFGDLWKYQVEGQIYAQPLYAEKAQILIRPLTFVGPPELVRKNVLIVATLHNLVYAFDAGDAGISTAPSTNPFWVYDAGSGKADPGMVPVDYLDVYNSKSPDTFNLSPVIGIVSTPVIDLEHNTVYLVAMTKNVATKKLEHHVHEIDIASGKPRRPPLKLNQVASFPDLRLQRPALLLDGPDLYIAFSSFGDREPYNGSITHVDVRTMKQEETFIVSPNNGGGGIWQSGGGPAMDEDGFIYVVTGNGQNMNENNGRDFDESDVKLNRQMTGGVNGRVVDYYTPSYQNYLNQTDADLGVGGAMVIPPQPGHIVNQRIAGCPAPGAPIKLLAHGSKAGLLYLINRNCMGGFDEHDNHTPSAVLACRNAHIHATPVFWQSRNGPRIYTVCEQDTGQGIKAFTILNGEWVKTPVAQNLGVNGHQLTLSALGNTPGSAILWMLMPAKGTKWGTEADGGYLLAFDAENLTQLYSSPLGQYAKFNTPTIANGHVYAPTLSLCHQPTPGPCPSMALESLSSVQVLGLF